MILILILIMVLVGYKTTKIYTFPPYMWSSSLLNAD